MGILEKRSAALSAEELENLKKPLGERVPYPMMGLGQGTDSHGNITLPRYLGTLERPLTIYSERSLDEVEGVALRNMVTPEMLPLFYKVMSDMDPRNRRRVTFIEGAPGAGKTFLGGELAGQLVSEKGAIKVDCTGLNLNELFYETVLDFKGNQRFYDALDDKIAKYNEHIGNKGIRDSILNPMSVDILRDCLGEAFVEEPGGRIGIDWGGVKEAHKSENGERLDSRQSTEIAIAGLMQVSRKEGLDGTGGNALGMATQEGLAPQAYREGRILILDELNRAKRGTFGVLHSFMQFAIGLDDECVVRNPLKEKGDKAAQNLHFTRAGMTAGFYVFATGNLTTDSDEVLELPEALSSRIVPIQVPKATVQGWQHRWCQQLMGFPVSTFYEANRDVWDKDIGAFERDLIKYRKQGEKREIPAAQLRDLREWRARLEGTENLAKFCDGAEKLVNPDSDWYKKAKSLSQLMEEISESYKKKVAVDFRKVSYFLNMAAKEQPVVRKPEGGPDVVPLIVAEDAPETPEDIRDRIGTHVTYVILDWIVSNTFDQGKDALGRQLLQLAQDCALIKPALNDAKHSNRKTVAELLDHNPYTSNDPDVQAELARAILCERLRERYPDISAGDDALMSVAMVRAALERVKEAGRDSARNHDGVNNNLIVFNTDAERVYAHPLAPAAVIDKAAGGAVAAPDLLPRESFLYSLAAPAMRQENLRALWTRGLSAQMPHHGAEGANAANPALAAAEARTGSPIGITTLEVGGAGGKAEALHVVWNKRSGAVLISGDGEIAPGLRRIFNRTGVSYINRNDRDAATTAARALQTVLGREGAEIGSNHIKRAFLMRAMLDSPQAEKEAGLANLLTRKDVRTYLPVYVAAGPKAA